MVSGLAYNLPKTRAHLPVIVTEPSNSVFISYRRSASAFLALAISQDLEKHGIDAFYDIEDIPSGQFGQIILNQIAARPYFLPILAPGTLERCAEPGDWLRREIVYALELKRAMVPLHTREFDFEDIDRFLPPEIAKEFRNYHGIEISHNHFSLVMQDLRARVLKPIRIPTTPTPRDEVSEVRRIVRRFVSTPPVTRPCLQTTLRT